MTTRVYGLAIAAFIGIHHVGDDVWRIRTQSAGGSFAEHGGVQAIEAFLGPTNAKRSPRPRGQATLANDRQAVRFQSPEGKLLAVIDSIHVTNGVVTVSGPLEASEGVFGGGCRFDRLNKRGTEFLLNAEDGWNRNETMYVPIPVFSTSRGGGFLVNTHAVMRLDAGKSDPKRWSIRYLGDHADLYYFTGGTLADVRQGALGLVGVGEKPKLAPGPVICRHYKAKDFDSFEKIRKVYDSYVREGTKPAALIIEPYPIKTAFAKPEAADSLAEMGGFFRAEGVPLMIWMQCGYPFHAVAHGYKPEYVVHCDIRTNGVISAKNSETVPSVRRNGFVNPDAGDQYANLRLLDITNQEAWKWYEENVIAFLVRNNIIGAKIDFCELVPDESVCYGDFSVAYHWKMPDVFKGVGVHHAYPMLFNAKFAEAIKRLAGGRADSFVFCRGGGLGCSRTAYYWAGDQVRTFPKLRDQLRGLLNSRLSAMPYMSFDLAGYIKKWKDYSLAEEERIVVRALGFARYFPFIQTHGDVTHVYNMDESVRKAFREAVAFSAKVDRDVAPLVEFWTDDPRVWDIDDEFVYGEDVLVAPVLDDADKRTVYLPKGLWTNNLTGETLTAKDEGLTLEVCAPLGSVPTFTRRGK